MPHTTDLPSSALLARYQQSGDYVDCFTTHVDHPVTLAQFIKAFYASIAFYPERTALSLIGRGASQQDIDALANGHTQEFAAWSVEARTPDQILLCDFMSKTRSWLMVQPSQGGTQIFFGSAVIKTDQDRQGRRKLTLIFSSTLWFHQVYSRLLLGRAAHLLAANEPHA